MTDTQVMAALEPTQEIELLSIMAASLAEQGQKNAAHYMRHAIARIETLHRITFSSPAEPVAYTGSGSMMALKDGREGYIWPQPADAHPIPLYATPLPPPAADAEVRKALEPFAKYADAVLKRRDGAEPEPVPDDRLVFGMDGQHISIGDLRRARSALATPPSVPAQQGEDINDALDEILQPFHWEAWKAALFSDHADGWPNDDEQEAICRRVDSMAVGEHYQGWADDVREKIAALFATPPSQDQKGVEG